jgi:hypothetical protein
MQTKGFMASLFDFSFTDFITVKWIKFIFTVIVICNAILPLGGLYFFLKNPGGSGILVVLLSCAFFIPAVLVSRMGLEWIVVLFRVEEHLRFMAFAAKPESAAMNPPSMSIN